MSRLIDPPESYQELCDTLELRSGIPYVEDWSAASDYMQLITDYVLQKKPQNILECGSGLTTLMLAKSCQKNGYGHVVSLESGGVYAGQTRQAISAYGLSEYATIVHAPLVSQRIDDEVYQWYDLTDVVGDCIDMLVIDGPPGLIQKNSRYPALPLLMKRLSNHCHVFMDDAAREDELEVVNLWKKLSPMIESDYVETERGCARLVVNQP